MMKIELLNPYYVEKYLEMQQKGASTLGLRNTVNLWIEPVTDRSMKDVTRVKELLGKGWKYFSEEERTEWLGNLKGALNISDLVRIQNNIQLLSDVLAIDLTVEEVPEIPNEKFYNQLIVNVEAIRNAYCIHADTPKTPSSPLNSYSKWNNIEKILQDVYRILLNNFYYYCGNEIYAGDAAGLLL